jgi:ribonuclease P protein component
VLRNRIRRRIKEAYRVHESAFRYGFDIVIVARQRAADAPYRAIEQAMLKAFYALGVMKEEE